MIVSKTLDLNSLEDHLVIDKDNIKFYICDNHTEIIPFHVANKLNNKTKCIKYVISKMLNGILYYFCYKKNLLLESIVEFYDNKFLKIKKVGLHEVPKDDGLFYLKHYKFNKIIIVELIGEIKNKFHLKIIYFNVFLRDFKQLICDNKIVIFNHFESSGITKKVYKQDTNLNKVYENKTLYLKGEKESELLDTFLTIKKTFNSIDYYYEYHIIGYLKLLMNIIYQIGGIFTKEIFIYDAEFNLINKIIEIYENEFIIKKIIFDNQLQYLSEYNYLYSDKVYVYYDDKYCNSILLN